MRGASLSRIWAVCLKEFIQFRRDRVTFGLLLGLPSILLLIYGYAVELDAHRLPTTVIDLARDSFSRELTSRLELSDYFQITQADTTPEAADHEMRAGRQVITVTIPADFGAKLMRGTQPQLLVEADMSDPATAGGALPALAKIVAQLTPPPDGATTPKVGVELIGAMRESW